MNLSSCLASLVSMNTMGDMIEIFNTRLLDFVDDMDKIYKGARQIRKGLSLAIVIDRKTPLALFRNHVVVPFGDSIKKRDETFLLAHDYAESVKTVSELAPDVSSVDIVKELKGIWHTLNQDNKNAIWAHMQLLTTLAERVPVPSSSASKRSRCS